MQCDIATAQKSNQTKTIASRHKIIACTCAGAELAQLGAVGSIPSCKIYDSTKTLLQHFSARHCVWGLKRCYHHCDKTGTAHNHRAIAANQHKHKGIKVEMKKKAETLRHGDLA